MVFELLFKFFRLCFCCQENKETMTTFLILYELFNSFFLLFSLFILIKLYVLSSSSNLIIQLSDMIQTYFGSTDFTFYSIFSKKQRAQLPFVVTFKIVKWLIEKTLFTSCSLKRNNFLNVATRGDKRITIVNDILFY